MEKESLFTKMRRTPAHMAANLIRQEEDGKFYSFLLDERFEDPSEAFIKTVRYLEEER